MCSFWTPKCALQFVIWFRIVFFFSFYSVESLQRQSVLEVDKSSRICVVGTIFEICVCQMCIAVYHWYHIFILSLEVYKSCNNTCAVSEHPNVHFFISYFHFISFYSAELQSALEVQLKNHPVWFSHAKLNTFSLEKMIKASHLQFSIITSSFVYPRYANFLHLPMEGPQMPFTNTNHFCILLSVICAQHTKVFSSSVFYW